jgi:hypothetical protein
MRTELAVRIMKLVRIIAVVLIIVSAALYFTAKEYALYPAIAGFAIIALINIPLNIWLAVRRGKLDKKELDKYEAERKEK